MRISTLTCLLITLHCNISLFSQAEVAAWGNFTGIRLEGQLVKFNTCLGVAGTDMLDIAETAKERQRPLLKREGNIFTIKTRIKNYIEYTETITDTHSGEARVDIKLSSTKDTTLTAAYFCLAAAYFCVRIPREEFGEGKLEIHSPDPATQALTASQINDTFQGRTKGIKITSKDKWVEINQDHLNPVMIRKGKKDELEILWILASGALHKGDSTVHTFYVRVYEKLRNDLATIHINTDITGRRFEGFGGNFRLQNAKTDPQVIDYCLNNMRVARARVEMPWGSWHKDENIDPLEAARNGVIDKRVADAMENAQRIYRLGIPLIVSAWFPPTWAITGTRSFGRNPDGTYGNPLNQEKINEIYASITSYLIFLKEKYNVEVDAFSFNESDLGINVHQSALEHRDLIKGLGAYLKAKGLKTQLLLGDTADANGWPFVEESIKDTSTLPFIHAVSFHSWRGFETETLQKWYEAAQRTHKPLIVGEGSMDAAAWNFPAIFQEQIYIMEEINLYIRILSICQPLSILQWQLTADYSPLAGGGIFGDHGPLRPTQRFYNFKQLGETPKDLMAMPATTDRSEITCAALGDNVKSTYVVHLVNNGPSRPALITGFPRKTKHIEVLVTDAYRGVKPVDKVKVSKGLVRLNLDKMSYTTILIKK